jgi:MATE family multidrug resistance protein
MMLLGVVDTVMVGHASPQDLAGVAVGNIYFFACVVFGMGVLFSLDPVVSQAVGAGDEAARARGVQRGVLLASALAVAGMLALLLAEPVLIVFRQPAEVIPLAAGYARACALGVFPFYLFVVVRQTLQAQSRVTPILLAIVAANLVNVLFNWAFVFGNLGSPAMGAVGSGWASSLSRIVMAACLLLLSWPLIRGDLRPFRPESLRWAPLRRMLRLGTPIGLQMGMEYGAFGLSGMLMGLLGTISVAGHQIALNLASLTFMVPLGVAQATAVLVGQGVGGSDPGRARRAAVGGLLAGAGFMTVTMLMFILAPGPLARLYSSDAAVVTLAIALLPIAGVFQVVDGLQAVAAGVLRGVGDTRVPMLVNLVGFWVVGLPLGGWLAFRRDAGPAGIWWGLALGLAVVAALLLARIHRRMHGALERVIMDDDDGEP